MNTQRFAVFFSAATVCLLCLNFPARGADMKAILDSTNGSSSFVVCDSASNRLAEVRSDGSMLIATNLPGAYKLSVNGMGYFAESLFLGTGMTVDGRDISDDGAKLDTVFGWGNHSTNGYLTGYTETDPAFTSSVAAAITGTHTDNWSTAYGWGNHGTQGYLTSESDPSFAASIAAGIAGSDTQKWNNAHSWGNHAAAGYATGTPLYVESEPKWTAASNLYLLKTSAVAAYVAKTGATMSGALSLPAGGLGVGSTQLVVTAGGNVGIGTASPQAKLDVNGTARVKVVQITGGSDVAERFSISGTGLAPGTVVSIDPTRPGALKISDSPYDRKAAGIVSGAGGVECGLVLSQAGTPADGEYTVAVSGRVYCRADASFGSIQPGDLLTTSGVPGYAMKASDNDAAQGAVIGKAMTSLDSGKGLVLVLVTLQ